MDTVTKIILVLALFFLAWLTTDVIISGQSLIKSYRNVIVMNYKYDWQTKYDIEKKIRAIRLSTITVILVAVATTIASVYIAFIGVM